MSQSDTSQRSDLHYTNDEGRDYNLDTIDADVQRMIGKIDSAIHRFEQHHEFMVGSDVVDNR